MFADHVPSVKSVAHRSSVRSNRNSKHILVYFPGFTTIGSPPARSEPAPVAHVHPHPSSPAISGSSARKDLVFGTPKPCADEFGLKRSVSTDHLTRALAETRLAEARLSVEGLFENSSGARRWNSFQNIPDEYGVIPQDTDPTLLDQSQFQEAEDVFNGRHRTMPRAVSAAPFLTNSESNLRPLHRDSSLSNSQPSLNGKLTADAAETHYAPLSKDLITGSATAELYAHHNHRRRSADYVNPTSDIHLHYNRPPTYGGGYSSLSAQERHDTRYGSSTSYPHVDRGYGLSAAAYSAHGASGLPHEGESLVNDITSWQQKHQEQLRQQKLEMSRVFMSEFVLIFQFSQKRSKRFLKIKF